MERKKVKSLPELLNSFVPSDSVKVLTDQFEEIAKAAIFGGYFDVNNGSYRIYPLDIEFYFHDEKTNGIQEPQMYHKGKLPYFPKGSICPNRSGVDVTFEDENKKYRASFLIRGYKYQDDIESYVNDEKKKDYNPQYLWEDMFGNASCLSSNGLCIKWISTNDSAESKVSKKKRVNIPICKDETVDRLWRFSKSENVE